MIHSGLDKHRNVPNAPSHAGNPTMAAVSKDHETDVRPVATVEYSHPWLGLRGSAGEWSP
jgi:hypothetical protein